MTSGLAEPHRAVRVLITGPDLAPTGWVGGVQQHVRYLLEAFSGDEDVVLTPFAITTMLREEPWALKGVRLAGKYVRLLFVLPGVDVVHVNSTIDNRSVIRDGGVLLLAGLLGKPVLVQFHGGRADALGPVTHGALGWLARRALRSARLAVFLSADQGVPVAEIFGLAEDRVRYVSNYVPTQEYGSAKESATHGLRVLYLGRLHAAKGVLETIEAFRRAALPSAELTVAGTGPIEAEVRAAVEATPGARFVGFVGGEDKRALLERADVFALPSAYPEGMPYGALEALASGAALVASDVAGLSPLVRDGDNGVVVAPLDVAAIKDALQRLAENPAELARMQAASRRLAQAEFSLVAGRRVFSAMYREVAGVRDEEPV